MRALNGLAGSEEDDSLRGALEFLGDRPGDRLQDMVLSLEMRDFYTAWHQNRVSLLAAAMARETGFSESETQGIALAAAIHDIGKIFVPASILNKPGSLNDFEQYMVRVHPRAGSTILKPIEFPWPVARIVVEHHERLDGSGYPAGLHGDEIHRQSRVVAVADVMESMTSKRPYRRALPISSALDHLTRHRGTCTIPKPWMPASGSTL